MAEQESFTRDDAGNIVDPPTLSMHERAVNDAAASGDERALARAQKRYHDERAAVVAEIESETNDDAPDDPNGDDGPTPDDPAADFADSRTTEELHAEARDRGLSTSGTKRDVAERILDHDDRNE